MLGTPQHVLIFVCIILLRIAGNNVYWMGVVIGEAR